MFSDRASQRPWLLSLLLGIQWVRKVSEVRLLPCFLTTPYLLQVISTELNRAVLELLQQLLFWQERAKTASPYNLAKRKRLVSGLRCVQVPLRAAPCTLL